MSSILAADLEWVPKAVLWTVTWRTWVLGYHVGTVSAAAAVVPGMVSRTESAGAGPSKRRENPVNSQTLLPRSPGGTQTPPDCYVLSAA